MVDTLGDKETSVTGRWSATAIQPRPTQLPMLGHEAFIQGRAPGGASRRGDRFDIKAFHDTCPRTWSGHASVCAGELSGRLVGEAVDPRAAWHDRGEQIAAWGPAPFAGLERSFGLVSLRAVTPEDPRSETLFRPTSWSP